MATTTQFTGGEDHYPHRAANISFSKQESIEKEECSYTIPSEPPDTVKAESVRILFVVVFYILVSVALVVLNKYLLSYAPIKFDYPLFVTWFQLLFALACIIFLGYLNSKGFKLCSNVPPFHFDIKVGMDVLPMTVIYVAMLATNNLCLKYVEVSFFQIARSLSVCFQLLLTWLYLKQRISVRAFMGCVVVVVGFLVGSEGEVRFSWLGVLFGVLSSAFVALNGVFIKTTLAALNNNEWKSISYNTFLATLLMMPLLLFSGELVGVVDTVVLHTLQPATVMEVMDVGGGVGVDVEGEGVAFSMTQFWILMLLASLLGFLINVAVILLVKYTSPLTSVIVGTTKSCIQTLLSIFIFGNPVSFVNGVGLVLTIVGAFVYSMARFTEMNKNKNGTEQKKDG